MIETAIFLGVVIAVPYFCYMGEKIEKESIQKDKSK